MLADAAGLEGRAATAVQARPSKQIAVIASRESEWLRTIDGELAL